MGDLTPKQAAKAAGELHYFTGRPCKYGHLSKRFVSTGGCAQCVHERTTADRQADPEKHRELGRGQYWSRREMRLQDQADWRAKNKGKKAAAEAMRRARRRQATPSWLTEEQRLEMRSMYDKARQLTIDTGTQYEVDHIVALGAKDVCGLHVPWNLKIITQVKNLEKGNRHAED